MPEGTTQTSSFRSGRKRPVLISPDAYVGAFTTYEATPPMSTQSQKRDETH
jgi:hypothetical protein